MLTDAPPVTLRIKGKLMRLYAGTAVVSTDGRCGEIADLVVDPLRLRLTHLVVEDLARDHGSRLVPASAMLGYVEGLRLSWSMDQVLSAPNVQGAGFLDRENWPAADQRWEVGLIRMLPWPHRRLAPISGQEQRVSSIVSSDGRFVGQVEGLVLDDAQAITHLILNRGRLWSHRQLILAVSQVKSMSTDRVLIRLSSQEVEALPSTQPHHHHA
jgi:sporulation protein YlmC with PRC-barrel domain